MSCFNVFIFICFFSFISFLFCNESHGCYFGGLGPFEVVDEVEGFPETNDFFNKYVKSNKPLRMKGAAANSPALKLWTDDYFMNRGDLEEQYVIVEKEKLENRRNSVLNITFKEFLRMYNVSNNYLVNQLPPPLELVTTKLLISFFYSGK